MSNFDLNISVLTPGPGTADGCLDLDVTLSVRGGEGGNRTSHHLIPIQQHNVFKTRPAFAIVKPLVGEVMRQTLNRTDWWLESFRFCTWSRNYSLIRCVFDRIQLSLHLWYDGYMLSAVSIFSL